MEENKNSDFKNKNNSVENNSNPRLGLSNSNFRPGSSNSNPRPGPSNPNSRPGPSNSNPRPSSSSNHWLERDRDRKIPKKRSNSENDDWGRDNKLNKRETPDKVKKEGNCENDGNERPNENSSDIPLMSLQDIALASQRMAVATMSQQSQQQMAVAMPQQSQQQMAVAIPQQSQPQIMHGQAIPYPSYGYNASENYHMDPNQGAYAANPFSSMMPVNSQWPASNAMPATASNIASTSGMGISNSMEMIDPANVSIYIYPYMNMSNNDGSSYGMGPIMPSISNCTPFTVMNNVDPIVPVFNYLEPITITRAVLTPPLPGERQSHRLKPPQCKTAFVGNLPEKITEEIVKDAFKICGPISAVRMHTRNFCHISFVNMKSVDQALFLSGFRIRIDESEDPAFNGKLYVDYAYAMDATENDSQLISLISIFLHVHPFGASIDYICSYLVKTIPTLIARDVENFLRRFPRLFREVCTGIGATLEKKWKYIGFVQNN